MKTRYKIEKTRETMDGRNKICLTQNVYKSLECLTAVARRKFLKNDILMVKTCIHIVEKLHVHGNETLKKAVEEVFIYPLLRLFNSGSKKEQKTLQSLISFGLK